MKKFLERKNISLSWKTYFVTAMGAMAQGLFASLLIGVSNMSSGSVLKLTSGGLMLIGIISLVIFSRLQITSKNLC